MSDISVFFFIFLYIYFIFFLCANVQPKIVKVANKKKKKGKKKENTFYYFLWNWMNTSCTQDVAFCIGCHLTSSVLLTFFFWLWVENIDAVGFCFGSLNRCQMLKENAVKFVTLSGLDVGILRRRHGRRRWARAVSCSAVVVPCEAWQNQQQ